MNKQGLIQKSTFGQEKNKRQRKYGFLIMVVYLVVCLSPYFINSFNQIAPKLGGIPFTVWSILVVVLLFCVFLYYMSKFVWFHYDDE